MGENRDKSLNIRMSDEEMRRAKEVAKRVKLPTLIREYINTLYESIEKTDSLR